MGGLLQDEYQELILAHPPERQEGQLGQSSDEPEFTTRVVKPLNKGGSLVGDEFAKALG